MKRIIYSIIALGLLAGIFSSCSEETLDPTLKQEKDINTSINTDDDLAGVLRGVYNRITSSNYYGRDYIIYGEVMGDNCFTNGNSGRFIEPAEMDIGPSVGYVQSTWYQIYRVISAANVILNTDKETIEGNEEDINNIYGQAYAIRAMAHFDLMKLYGQQHVTGGSDALTVPFINKFASDLEEFDDESLNPEREEYNEMQTRIYTDLEKAIDNLSGTSFSYASKDYHYFSLEAAHALRSRIALYFQDWSQAITDCEAVINSEKYEIVDSADYVSLWQNDGGADAILEMAYNETDNNNISGLAYMYRGGSYGDVAVTPEFVSIFDSTDVRMMGQTEVLGVPVNMIGSGPEMPEFYRNNGKWPDMSNFADNVQLIRYEEVILNYAEALMEEGETGIDGLTALDYLNMIPENRGASTYSEANLDNILNERRKELCFEGFRFHDLVRRGLAVPSTSQNAGYNDHEEIAYGDYRLAFPIPENELEANSNIKQNEGY
ncbi:MAG: RagB/SusD family nutrient uptake outer membrane protein [bacterium]